MNDDARLQGIVADPETLQRNLYEYIDDEFGKSGEETLSVDEVDQFWDNTTRDGIYGTELHKIGLDLPDLRAPDSPMLVDDLVAGISAHNPSSQVIDEIKDMYD